MGRVFLSLAVNIGVNTGSLISPLQQAGAMI